jgi:hypothetical protein
MSWKGRAHTTEARKTKKDFSQQVLGGIPPFFL